MAARRANREMTADPFGDGSRASARTRVSKPNGISRGDSCYYPDSGKFAVMKEGAVEVIVKGIETDYFDGEE